MELTDAFKKRLTAGEEFPVERIFLIPHGGETPTIANRHGQLRLLAAMEWIDDFPQVVGPYTFENPGGPLVEIRSLALWYGFNGGELMAFERVNKTLLHVDGTLTVRLPHDRGTGRRVTTMAFPERLRPRPRKALIAARRVLEL